MKKSYITSFFTFAAVCIISFLGFGFNSFSVVSSDVFENYNLDSQSLVFESVSQDLFPLNGYGLAAKLESGETVPYISQVGIQGYLFEILDRAGCSSQSCLQKFNALLFSLTFASLVLLVFHKVDKLLAFLVFSTFLGSPWITLLAKNVYWIPFSWMLPSLVVLKFFVNSEQTSLRKKIALPMLFSFFMFKFLAGYEYATSVILFAATIPFLKAYVTNDLIKSDVYKYLRQFRTIFFTGTFAFVSALVVHASLRGTSIKSGLLSIYEVDVKRRTFGNSLDFPTVYADSLNADVFEVLRLYIFQWTTSVLDFGHPDFATVHFGSKSLWMLVVSALILSLLRFFNSSEKVLVSMNSSGLVQNLLALSIPFSWFILAKSHSFIHTHLNFVLWYMLTIPILIWTLIGNSRFFYESLKARNEC